MSKILHATFFGFFIFYASAVGAETLTDGRISNTDVLNQNIFNTGNNITFQIAGTLQCNYDVSKAKLPFSSEIDLYYKDPWRFQCDCNFTSLNSCLFDEWTTESSCPFPFKSDFVLTPNNEIGKDGEPPTNLLNADICRAKSTQISKERLPEAIEINYEGFWMNTWEYDAPSAKDACFNFCEFNKKVFELYYGSIYCSTFPTVIPGILQCSGPSWAINNIPNNALPEESIFKHEVPVK